MGKHRTQPRNKTRKEGENNLTSIELRGVSVFLAGMNPLRIHTQEEVGDGLFMMQHNIPKKSSGWSQSLEKDVGKSCGSQSFFPRIALNPQET